MPSNQTANYALSQWSRTDQVKMEDFNADNAKIDAALSGLAQTLTAHTAELARKGNCQVSTYTYTGNGKFGEANPTTITFPRGMLLLVIMTQHSSFYPLLPGTKELDWLESSGHYYSPMTWTETSLSLHSTRQASYQFNNINTKYTVLAVCMADGT